MAPASRCASPCSHKARAPKRPSEAGADLVGMDDLAEQVKKGELNFDVVVAAPDAMRVVGALGKILGPRGLMPNPKVGTVTPDVGEAVRKAKAGQVQYRTDKAGIIHCSIGTVNFEVAALRENLQALIGDLHKSKPSAAKGISYEKSLVSSTMGPGIQVDKASLESLIVFGTLGCPEITRPTCASSGPATGQLSKTAGAD